MTVKNLEPAAVARALTDGSIVLVDVREPSEYAAERIEGALLFPLSTFDPAALPASDGRPLVFHCAGGVRSAQAVVRCQEAGLSCDSHVAGGILAWKKAGLPTLRAGAATGPAR
jgi:rhodanese-related sulfurtransferase